MKNISEMTSLLIKVFTHPETDLPPTIFSRDSLSLIIFIIFIPNRRFLVFTLLMVISVPVTC